MTDFCRRISPCGQYLITFGIPYKEAFKSFLPHLIRIHPEYIGIGCQYHSSSDFCFLRIGQNAFIGIGYYACLQASLQINRFLLDFCSSVISDARYSNSTNSRQQPSRCITLGMIPDASASVWSSGHSYPLSAVISSISTS